MQVVLAPMEEHAKAIMESGDGLPPPVRGFAMIDTGAAITCVDQSAAERAGLVAVDSGLITSVTHEAEVAPVFMCKLDFTGWGLSLPRLRVLGANLSSQGLVALIGRDALSSCIFIYNGLDGSFSLSL